MLKTFSANLANKGCFKFTARQGLQSSFRYERGKDVLTVLLAKDEALITSSKHLGTAFTLRSPKIQQILCKLVVSHFGSPVTSTFRGKQYVSDTLVPLKVKNGKVVYKDCMGNKWIDSSCTESNSLEIYDAFATRDGEAIALMLPWFFPMESSENYDSDYVVIPSSVIRDYSDFLSYPVESVAPKSGFNVLEDSIVSSSDFESLHRIRSITSGFFSHDIPLKKESSNVGIPDSISFKVNNHTLEVGLFKDNPVNSSFYTPSLDLVSLTPLFSSWGISLRDLRDGVTVNSNFRGFSDFVEIFNSVEKEEILVEPAKFTCKCSVKSGTAVNSILSSWGINNNFGYFNEIQQTEVSFND